MLSLVTISPIISAFHSCCLSHHVFDQVNLWLAWVGIETAIFWQCSPGTVETQRLYPLYHGPRMAIKFGFFGFINPIICSPYLVFRSRVRTEFVIVFIRNPEVKFGRNVVNRPPPKEYQDGDKRSAINKKIILISIYTPTLDGSEESTMTFYHDQL